MSWDLEDELHLSSAPKNNSTHDGFVPKNKEGYIFFEFYIIIYSITFENVLEHVFTVINLKSLVFLMLIYTESSGSSKIMISLSLHPMKLQYILITTKKT